MRDTFEARCSFTASFRRHSGRFLGVRQRRFCLRKSQFCVLLNDPIKFGKIARAQTDYCTNDQVIGHISEAEKPFGGSKISTQRNHLTDEKYR